MCKFQLLSFLSHTSRILKGKSWKQEKMKKEMRANACVNYANRLIEERWEIISLFLHFEHFFFHLRQFSFDDPHMLRNFIVSKRCAVCHAYANTLGASLQSRKVTFKTKEMVLYKCEGRRRRSRRRWKTVCRHSINLCSFFSPLPRVHRNPFLLHWHAQRISAVIHFYLGRADMCKSGFFFSWFEYFHFHVTAKSFQKKIRTHMAKSYGLTSI